MTLSPPYLGLLPAGEVDVVAEEVGHALLRHLTLQRLQQVCKPLKGLRLWAQPVEVDLWRTATHNFIYYLLFVEISQLKTPQNVSKQTLI